MLIEKDFKFILANAGKDILINNVAARAVLSNADYGQKKISTLTEIKQGDLIDYEGKWLVVTDVNKDYKYKAIMQKCNYEITIQTGTEEEIVGYDDIGRPIYEEVPVYSTFPSVVESLNGSFGVSSGQIVAADGKIFIKLQENEDSLQLEVNMTFDLWGKQWVIKGIDRSKKGLIILTAELNI